MFLSAELSSLRIPWEKRFGELEAKMDTRFDETNSRIDRIISSLNTLAKRQEIGEEERLVMGHQLERLDVPIDRV